MEHHVPGLGVVDPAHPDLSEIMQRPEPAAPVPVPVRHEGPMPTQELPAVLGTAEQWAITTVPQVVLTRSRTRKKATLISTDNPILIMPRRSNIGTMTGALWPANVPLVYTAETELSVVVSTGTATLSVITEDWSR